MNKEEQQFKKALDIYWKKVQDIYNPYASQSIEDGKPLLYYVFQTDIRYEPDLMIVGINPGDSCHDYPYLLRKKDGRVSNYYLSPKNEKGKQGVAWAQRLQSVFDYKPEKTNNSYLSQIFENCVGTNKIFINTRRENGCAAFKNIHSNAKTLLEELIQIVNPKHIIALGLSPFNTLKQEPVKWPKNPCQNFRCSKHNGIPLAYIPNPSGLCSRYYNTDEKVKCWQETMEKFLRNELVFK